jgi:hypothetical protein
MVLQDFGVTKFSALRRPVTVLVHVGKERLASEQPNAVRPVSKRFLKSKSLSLLHLSGKFSRFQMPGHGDFTTFTERTRVASPCVS